MPKYSITVEEKVLVSYEVEAPDLLTARFRILNGDCEDTRIILPWGSDKNFVDEQLAPEYDSVVSVETLPEVVEE